MHLQGQIIEFDFSVVSLLVFLAGKFSLKTRSHMVATKSQDFLRCLEKSAAWVGHQIFGVVSL